ncbi:MAG: phosphotransferase [Gammaproteobacteria bacterium]
MPLRLTNDELMTLLKSCLNSQTEEIKIFNIETLSGGVLNQNLKLETNHGDFVIKIFSQVQLDPNAPATHQEIYSLQQHLANSHFPIPPPIGFHENFKGHDILIMPFVRGKTPDIHPEFLLRFGKMLADFHNQLAEYPRFKRAPNDVLIFLSELGNSLWRGITKFQIRAEISYSTNLFRYAFNTLKYPHLGALPHGINHGDLHLGNLLEDEEGRLVLLDLELCSDAPYLKDIANALCMFCFERNQGASEFNPEFALHLLSGYHLIRPLTKNEINLLPVFLKDRAWLERIGNHKLVNEGKPPGSPFAQAEFQAIQRLVSPEHWILFAQSVSTLVAPPPHHEQVNPIYPHLLVQMPGNSKPSLNSNPFSQPTPRLDNFRVTP